MNLIKNTLINNFISYTPFSFHLNNTNKKARSFWRPGFLFVTVYLQSRINTTWSYWYMIILFFAAIVFNTYHSLRVRTRIPLTKSS